MERMTTDVAVIGGSAAGLMCAIEAGKRGRRVIVLEHNDNVGEKIRISGGGRCNFTNLNVEPRCYLSGNPHFCKSALSRYTSRDFISLVEKHNIGYHEKTLGQLFCDGSSGQIIDMLLKECSAAGVSIRTGTRALAVSKKTTFLLSTTAGELEARSLVIATGGLSIPKLGATDFGYRVARQFGMGIVEPRPGLVPLKFDPKTAAQFGELSGVSAEAIVTLGKTKFREQLLFTHRGLSGPAILQISSYWKEGEELAINLLPDVDTDEYVATRRDEQLLLSTVLEQRLPRRLSRKWFQLKGGARPVRQYPTKELRRALAELTAWKIIPAETEGFAKAEVTVGGVDTEGLSSKTMESRNVPGLYFVGEVVDVTGWLGGYNFQWAWSSGWVAGQYV